MDATPFSLIPPCTKPLNPKPRKNTPFTTRGASAISSLALLGATSLHALPSGTVPSSLGVRTAGLVSTGLAAVAEMMYVAPLSSAEGDGIRGGGVKRGSGRSEKSGKKKEGKRWWVDSLFGKKKGKGGKVGKNTSEVRQPTGEIRGDEQVGHYDALHLLAEAGPLIADTTGQDKPVPVQAKISSAAIQVTINCPPTLPRSNPASKGEGIEGGGDAVISKAEKVRAAGTSESVADRGGKVTGEMRTVLVHVVSEKDAIHEDTKDFTRADRGRGVEMGKYATPTKQTKRTQSVPARTTSTGDISRGIKKSENETIGAEPNVSSSPKQSSGSSPNTSPNASPLSRNSLSSTPGSSVEADDLLKAVREETKRQCAEEYAADKKQMAQENEEKLTAEREQSAAQDKETREKCARTIAAKEAETRVEFAKEKSELEAIKKTEQRNALVAQKRILEGRHNKQTAANNKEHEAQLAAKDRDHEAQLAAIRESLQQQTNQQVIPKHKADALLEFVNTFPQGFEKIHTDGTKLLCGLDALVKTMEATHPSLQRPTVPELQALLESDVWRQQTEEFTAFEYDPEQFSAYEIDMTNQNDFRFDQLGSLLTLWGHTDGRDLNLRIGCFVDGQGPELLVHANEDPAIIVWIHNDAANLKFCDDSTKGHYMGMKPIDHAGRAAAQKESDALREGLLKQQSEDKKTILQLRQVYKCVKSEEKDLGVKVARLETANTSLRRKAERLTDNIAALETGKSNPLCRTEQLTGAIAGLETDKTTLKSRVKQLVDDVTQSEADRAGLAKKVEQLQEGVVSIENTKLKALYKASVTTTVEQGRFIAESRGRPTCQCGGLRPAGVKGPHLTPGQPVKKAVENGGKAKPFIFGDPAVETGVNTKASRSEELAARPINHAKRSSKRVKSSGSSYDAPVPESTDYVERTNIFDTGDSAIKAGDKARAANKDGSMVRPGQKAQRPSSFAFGAAAKEAGEKSENSGFQFKIPLAKPAGPSGHTIPFCFGEPAETAGEKFSRFRFGASAEVRIREATKPNHSDSEQPAKKSRGMSSGSETRPNALNTKVFNNAEGQDLFDLGTSTDKTGEKEEKALDDGKLTDPLSPSKETEQAAYELGRTEAKKELAVVNEELKVVRSVLAEVEGSLRVTTEELDRVSVLRPGCVVEEDRELELWRSGQLRIVDSSTLHHGAQAGRENDSGTEFDLSRSNERSTGDAMTGVEQERFEEPQPSSNEACETGNSMTGVEEDVQGQTKLPNDDDSEIGGEVPDSSICNASEAGEVVMGNMNDEDGLVDDLADRIEQLNIGKELQDEPLPSWIRHDGLARDFRPTGLW